MATHLDPGTHRARALRQQPNAAEQSLWCMLRGRQLGGWKFTQQFPIGPYFADFACRERSVVLELDDSHHIENASYDRARDEYMIRAGYSVFRVPTVSVLNAREAVCDSLLAVLEGRIEDFVEAPDLRFGRSFAKRKRRGFNSRNAIRQQNS